AVAWTAVPAGRRDSSRSGVVCERTAGRKDRRAGCETASTGGTVGSRGLHHPQYAEFHPPHPPRKSPPPQALHNLEADRAAAANEHSRRPVARSLPGSARADEYTTASPAAVE